MKVNLAHFKGFKLQTFSFYMGGKKYGGGGGDIYHLVEIYLSKTSVLITFRWSTNIPEWYCKKVKSLIFSLSPFGCTTAAKSRDSPYSTTTRLSFQQITEFMSSTNNKS